MKSFSSLLARPKILDRANDIIASLSETGRALFYLLSILIVGSSAGLLLMLNSAFLVTVPESGSALSEGIIGSPRLINPVLAMTDADRDMVMLIYSGLFKASPTGELAPDLAERHEISPDGKVYTVYLRADAVFHDGTPLTAQDVAFTVAKTLDPNLKSPVRANWQGVTVNVADSHTITFTLAAPYAPFIENLTLGILPKHLWEKIGSQEFPFHTLNTAPIGSGPFRIAGITRTPAGIATSYSLRSFDQYALGAPYLTWYTIRFYDSENALVTALRSGAVESGSGISPSRLSELSELSVIAEPLNRVFGVFFNQNSSEVLQDVTVRQALAAAVNRNALIDAALGGHAEPLYSPIPPALRTRLIGADYGPATGSSSPEIARAMLLDAGWVPDESGVLTKTLSGKQKKTLVLAFTLSTSNVPELRAVAESLADTWRGMGADVGVQVFESSDLAENVIRPRKYDALLFGEIIGRGLDLFAFWDSSQRNDPGLNIAMYANSSVDDMLAKLRGNVDAAQASELYAKFESEIVRDAPAVFLYSPDFVYVVPKDLRNVAIGSIENPSDRFDTVQTWYRSTDRVWKIFAQ